MYGPRYKWTRLPGLHFCVHEQRYQTCRWKREKWQEDKQIMCESYLGLVVWRPVSANPWLNFNPGFFFFSSKAFSRKIFSILFRVFNHQIVEKRIKLNLLFKLSYLNSNFALTLGYVNPALNNSALVDWLHFAEIILVFLVASVTWAERTTRTAWEERPGAIKEELYREQKNHKNWDSLHSFFMRTLFFRPTG